VAIRVRDGLDLDEADGGQAVQAVARAELAEEMAAAHDRAGKHETARRLRDQAARNRRRAEEQGRAAEEHEERATAAARLQPAD
jgi:hypothetical protein